MVQRRKIIRRTAGKASKPEVDEVDEVEDVDMELEGEDIDDDDDADLEEDDDEDEPAPVKAKKPVARKVVVDEDDEDKPEPVKAKKPLPAKAVKQPAKPVRKPVEDEDEDEAPAPKKTVKVKAVSETLIPDLLSALEEGKSILITRTGESTWSATLGGKAAANGNRVTGKAYWDQVLSPEFTKFQEEWKELTFAEKKARAKKSGAKWQEHEDEGIETMRLTAAVRDAEGIEKYKEEYRDRDARAALRG